MSEKYRGQADDRVYTGQETDISYNVRRCIHAKECVNRLATVFDLNRKPWILPDGAKNAAEIAEVIEHCPSGALHYQRKDGGEDEEAISENRIILWQDGPLQVKGDLKISGANVEIEQETRVTLCRCGQSKNKPFCDNSHKEIGFHTETKEVVKEAEIVSGGQLHITATENGPYLVEGNYQIEDEDAKVLFAGSKTWLCRCGNSKSKPFCDGTHNKIGFEAE